MRPADERQGGFTLLEILIALIVLGLLMLGLSQGVRASLDLRQAQNRRLGIGSELDATQRLLRSVLGKLPLAPDGDRLVGTNDTPAFRGVANRVDFVGELPTGLGGNHPANMSLFVQNERLVLSWTPYRHERRLAPPPTPMEIVLLPGVETLELAYWPASVNGQPASWQSQWERPVAPVLMRVRLVFDEPHRRSWPDLIVAPRP
jgi:general secretion pathway protein J